MIRRKPLKHVSFGIGVANKPQICFGGGASHLRDKTEDVAIVVSREKGFSLEHLSENTARGPDVHALVILAGGKHDLGSPIPAGDDIFRQVARLVCDAPGESEVGDFQITIRVDQDVRGLFARKGDI